MAHKNQNNKKAKKDTKSINIITFVLFLAIVTGILGGFIYWILSDLPHIKALEEYSPIESSRVYSSDGKVIAEFYVERRTFIPHYEIEDHIKKAFISIEDIRFYKHPGIDFIRIFGALWQDIKAGEFVQGGSTITQQLAKMLFLKPEKSIIRKIKEALLSLQIERYYTKDEILGLYLNQTYFGTRAYGIEAASQTYFGKSTKDISIAEAALLASLPKAPSRYSPFKNPAKALQRRSLVLSQMLRHGFITEEKYKMALKVPLPITRHFRKYDAPYFIEFIRQNLEPEYSSKIYTAGYKIYSTLDYRIQKIAEDAIKEGILNIEKREKKGVQASLIAIDHRNGQIKAMVGGSDFWETQFNRATQALRQPGSAFKPFVYLAAIEKGMTLEDCIDDSPVSYLWATKGGAEGEEEWAPKNYDDQYYGDVTLKTALAKSLNAATVNLADMVGVQNIINVARRLGIKSELHPYLSIALGASDTTLMEMVSAYSVFTTGKRIEPIAYDRIVNRDGVVIDYKMPVITEAITEDNVDKIQELLKAVVDEGTGIRAKYLGRPLYGKTGTTNDCTDAWFIGFDDKLVVGVWVGRDDHTPIGKKETGSAAALPIWTEFMKNFIEFYK